MSSYFPGGVRFPFEQDVSTVAQQQYGPTCRIRIDMSPRYKTELGLRLDGYNFQIPSRPVRPRRFLRWSISGCTSRISIESGRPTARYRAHRLRAHALDAVAQPAGRGREPECRMRRLRTFPRTITRPVGRRSTAGRGPIRPAQITPTQLYWLTRDYRFGSSTLEAPLVGATFTNIDLSWAHEFRDGSAMKLTPFYRRGYNVIEQTAQILGFNYQTGSPIYGDVQYSNLGIQKATGVEALYTKELTLGLSMQIGATYISQFGNEPPGAFLQPAALALGETYRSPDLSPFQLNAAFNWRNAHGWRINPVLAINAGYPYGAGYYTAVYCAGKAVIVPNTSLVDDLLRKPPATSIRSIRARAPRRTSPPRAASANRRCPAAAHHAARRRRSDGRVQSAHAQRREIGLRPVRAELVQPAL